jgi:hypothetical protein
MSQHLHYSDMRRALSLLRPFDPIHPYLIHLYRDDDDQSVTGSFETFISDRNSTNAHAAMDLPNVEDSSWDSASQDSDVNQHSPFGHARWAID